MTLSLSDAALGVSAGLKPSARAGLFSAWAPGTHRDGANPGEGTRTQQVPVIPHVHASVWASSQLWGHEQEIVPAPEGPMDLWETQTACHPQCCGPPWGRFPGLPSLGQTHLCGPSGHCRAAGLSQQLLPGPRGWHLPRGQGKDPCSQLLCCAGCRTPGQCPVRTLRGWSVDPAYRGEAAEEGHRGGRGVPKSLPGRSMCSHVCAGHTGSHQRDARLLRSRQPAGTSGRAGVEGSRCLRAETGVRPVGRRK